MDIDNVLRSFELPDDQPHWQTALLAQLSTEPEPAGTPEQQRPFLDLEPMRSAVILSFTRPAAI